MGDHTKGIQLFTKGMVVGIESYEQIFLKQKLSNGIGLITNP